MVLLTVAAIDVPRGDLLKADAEALVNTVNCVGVMGKGVALQFKRAFPENYRQYKRACDAKELWPGKMFVVELLEGTGPRYIINFPTKIHWKGPSRLEWIRSGLDALIHEVQIRNIRSMAVPPLGCGNGGLDWSDVRPMIEEAFAAVPDVQVLLYPPEGAPAAETMDVKTRRPRFTRVRAMLIRLLHMYERAEGTLTKLEVQKLAYFLQAAGEPMRLQFTKGPYGPYAETLNHVLQDMEGHYLRGYGDRTKTTRMHVIDGALQAADETLANEKAARERLARVASLIEGFESPYGMELLATVHWIACQDPDSREDSQRAVLGVTKWSPRKRARYQPEHVEVAWERLRSLGWFADMVACAGNVEG